MSLSARMARLFSKPQPEPAPEPPKAVPPPPEPPKPEPTPWVMPSLTARDALKVPTSLISSDEMGRHVEVIKLMDKINREQGTISHTSERFRFDLAYYLFDNPSRGPIVEVGTMHGGFSCIFAYIAAVTGRQFFAVDISPKFLEQTKDTCRRFGVDSYATFYLGGLETFVRVMNPSRPDLVFIDSDHTYNNTLAELSLLHSKPPRCIALHDFNYKLFAEEHLFDRQLSQTNPIAVDRAMFDFFSSASHIPIIRRAGGYTWDGTLGKRENAGSRPDYNQDAGSEGLMLFYS